MKALICGVSGQDGTLLAQYLLGKGYEVIGTSRDATVSHFGNLKNLGLQSNVETTSMTITDPHSVAKTLQKYRPDEIYNLAGQTSVSFSFEQPAETIMSIALGTLNLLEAIRTHGGHMRFYNAGSSECFGDTGDCPASESSPFRPRSPYAVSKVSAHNMVANYRDAYGLFACTGILFNHESHLRHERFVTQKVIKTAARIADGSREFLEVGNIDVQRDWGWAPEYVDAMWRMLSQPIPGDFVIATGRTVSLEYFIAHAFNFFGLDYTKHITVNMKLYRPTDVKISRADPSKASSALNWRAEVPVEGVIENMCRHAYEQLRT